MSLIIIAAFFFLFKKYMYLDQVRTIQYSILKAWKEDNKLTAFTKI